MDRIKVYTLILYISSAAIVISITEARASIGSAIAHHHQGENQFVSTPNAINLAKGLKLIKMELLDSLPTSAKWDNEPTSPSDPYAQSPYYSPTPIVPPQLLPPPPPPLLFNSPPITTEPPCHDMAPPIPNNPPPPTPTTPILPSPLLPSPIIQSPYITNPPTTSPYIPTTPPPSLTYPPPVTPYIQYPPPPFPSTSPPLPSTPVVPTPPLESYPPPSLPYTPIPTTPTVPPPPLESSPPSPFPSTSPPVGSYPPPAMITYPPPSPNYASTPPTSSYSYPPPPYTPTVPPGEGLWCVAKPTIPTPLVEQAMNFACGASADCQPIQPNGPCFLPDTVINHASYAFNSYWQMTKNSGGTCDFGGTAMVVTVDPSYETCHFTYNFD